MSNESRMCGNCAKLREALSAALEQVNKVYDILSRPCVLIEEARQGCREARGVLIPALAEPPRNCDKFPNADRAELEYRAFCERMGIDSSIYGAMAWMLANDTEQLEGGNNNGDK